MPLGNPIRKQNESRMVSVLATEGQTVFTVQGGYIINQISVFRNGVRLSNSEDFTAGDGSTVTLNNEANIDDRIEFHIFDRFTVQNAIVSAASTQTISGDVVVNGKIFGNLDVPSVNTGILTATNLNFGKGDISGDLNVTGVTTVGKQVHVGTGVSIAAGGLNVTAGISTLSGIHLDDALSHTGDTDTKIRFPAADTFSVETAGSERLRVTSGGLMGLGTDSPSGMFEVQKNGVPSIISNYNNSKHIQMSSGGSGAGFHLTTGNFFTINHQPYADRGTDNNLTERFRITSDGDVSIADKIIHTGDTNTAIRFPAADTITAETSGTEAIRINNSGQFLVGVTAARTMLSGYTPSLQVEGTANSDSSVSIVENASAASGPSLWFGKTRGNSLGANTVVQSGDELGTIVFNGADGTDVQSMAAFIRAAVDGTPGSNDMPGRLQFHTTADGAASPTERLRITKAGLVLIGTTADVAGGATSSKLQIRGTSFDTSLALVANRTNAGGANVSFSKSRGSGQGDATVVQSGDTLGSIVWYGADGTDINTSAAQIDAQVDTTPGSNDMPGRIVFRTTADGAATSTERMRIDSSGRVGVNKTPSTAQFVVQNTDDSNINVLEVYNDNGNRSGGFSQNSSGDGTISAYKNDGTLSVFFRSNGVSYLTGGNFGINETAPSESLQIDGDILLGGQTNSGTADYALKFEYNNHQFAKIVGDGRDSSGYGDLDFYTSTGSGVSNLTQRMTIRADGKIGIGVDSPTASLHLAKASGDTIFELQRTNTNVTGAVGVLNFTASDGHSVASIGAYGDGDNEGAYIQFKTTSDASGNSPFSTGSDRYRIHSNGTHSWNNTTFPYSETFHFYNGLHNTNMSIYQNSSADHTVLVMRHGRGGLSGYSGKMISFRGNDNTEEGSIVTGTTSTAFNTSSDYRLKENEVLISDGITRLKQLKPYRFNFKKDPSVTVDGFFAHEVTPVVPQAVSGEKDAMAPETRYEEGDDIPSGKFVGDPKTYSTTEIEAQSLDYSKLTPLLTAALQEAVAKIETLEAKVAALEGS